MDVTSKKNRQLLMKKLKKKKIKLVLEEDNNNINKKEKDESIGNSEFIGKESLNKSETGTIVKKRTIDKENNSLIDNGDDIYDNNNVEVEDEDEDEDKDEYGDEDKYEYEDEDYNNKKINNYEKSTSTHIYSNNNYFVYPIHNILNTNIQKLNTYKLNENTKFHICIYRYIYNSESQILPFIQYLFYKLPKPKTTGDKEKDRQREIMFFPYLKKSNKAINELLAHLNKEVSTISGKELKLQGHINYRNDIYMFYNFDIKKKSVEELERKSKFWWCLIDEIINVKNVVNFPIKEQITDFFLQYKDLLFIHNINETKLTNTPKEFIYDKNNKKSGIVEIPSVGYHGTYYKIIPRIASIGINPSSYNSMMGSYYYFGTYRKSIRYAGWTSDYKPRKVNINGDEIIIGDREGRYDKGGIVRFAIFLGNMKVFLNHPLDKEDYSDLVKERIEINSKNKSWEMKTIKLHDHDGKWATEEEYDSVYIGKAKLENGKNFMNNPEFVVKKYEQQVPLTYHYLDKNTLLRNWKNDYDFYYIE